jgi:hypothetical protein
MSKSRDLADSAATINYIDGVTSDVQTQLTGKEPADATILKDADIGVTVQAYTAVLNATTASFLIADESKLDGIATGAEVNPSLISQVEAEAGTAVTERTFSALRVAQAVAALSPPMTNAAVKTAYEANANSNEFSDAEQTKLDNMAAYATAVVASLPSSPDANTIYFVTGN